MQKIVIITSGQPSANPRAVKEATLLFQKGYRVTFIYCPISPWADEFDKNLFKEFTGIRWISVGYHPEKNKIGFLYARVRKKYFSFVAPLLCNRFDANIKATVLFAQELANEAQKHKANLYIGHNLGAIAATYKAANKHEARAAFDAEDFHRGEIKAPLNAIIISIENTYFPLMNYCTVASPLIGQAYQQLFPSQIFTVINNVFSVKYLKKSSAHKESNSLSLFWFSQFIGVNRGIETVLQAINECNELDIKLHLLGNVQTGYKNQLLSILYDKEKLVFIEPLPLSDIFNTAAKYDVGLATEVPDTANRNFCLTNKIFTYLLAGNALVLSNTQAQSNFVEKYEGVGLLYQSGNSKALAELLKNLYHNKALLNNMKANAANLAKTTLNWETEGELFVNVVKMAILKS